MKNVTMCGSGFAELQTCELETINGGEAPKIPSGVTWKVIFDFVIDHGEEMKKGFIDGWNSLK